MIQKIKNGNDRKYISGDALTRLLFGTALLFLLLQLGRMLPYLQTELSIQIRFYFLAPAVVSAFVYVGFMLKGKQGKTAYQLVLCNYQSSEERIRRIFAYCLIALLCSWFTASYSIAIPAAIANVVATDTFTYVYQIQAVTEHGGPGFTGWYDLDLRDPTSGERVLLPLRRTDYPKTMYGLSIWRVGDTLCVRGRTSFVGTIIDEEINRVRLD